MHVEVHTYRLCTYILGECEVQIEEGSGGSVVLPDQMSLHLHMYLLVYSIFLLFESCIVGCVNCVICAAN